jgi:isoprenylcysteine carboxyl methyltransferase (ICMT) family protein YpbQ
MEKKMSVMGVGAKIAIPILVYLIAAEVVSLLTAPLFTITPQYSVLLVIGIALAVIGRLATGGLYKIFRDPMYVLQIFLTLPGLFLLFNSWLVLAGVIPAYIAYRVFVREEHAYLAGKYGDVYTRYVAGVPIKL